MERSGESVHPYCEFQMSGLCGGESCGFKPWTVLEGCLLSFVLLRSVEISCFRGKKKYLVNRHDFEKKLRSLQDVTREGWIFVWFSLSKFPSYLKGDPSPPLIIDILLLTRPVVAGFEVSRFVLSARRFLLIGEQIGALSKGFLVGQSAHGHLIILECVQALDRVSLHILRPVCTPLIWVKYSQNNKRCRNDIIWNDDDGAFASGGGGCEERRWWSHS